MSLKYKHYSFDLWLTLIKSNPEFKIKRAEYFFNHFNRKKLTLSQVTEIIRKIDIMCNNINERTGKSIDALEMYAMILYELEYDMTHINLSELVSLYHNCQQIMEHYPPTIYSDETIPMLIKLKELGASLSILSNTGFINGQSLRTHLKRLNIEHLFDFMLFSDEVDMSKPNRHFFQLMIIKSGQLYKNILHIGDSISADKVGADKAKINSLIIHGDTGLTIKNIL